MPEQSPNDLNIDHNAKKEPSTHHLEILSHIAFNRAHFGNRENDGYTFLVDRTIALDIVSAIQGVNAFEGKSDFNFYEHHQKDFVHNDSSIDYEQPLLKERLLQAVGFKEDYATISSPEKLFNILQDSGFTVFQILNFLAEYEYKNSDKKDMSFKIDNLDASWANEVAKTIITIDNGEKEKINYYTTLRLKMMLALEGIKLDEIIAREYSLDRILENEGVGEAELLKDRANFLNDKI
jgi:hypothetical protein